MRWIGILCFAALAGCVSTTQSPTPSKPPAASADATPTRADLARFDAVVARVEPVAERVCRDNGKNSNCDFKIVVVPQPGTPPNAYQSRDKSGRPVLSFNHALLATVRNSDELAFIMGHEAAHHIRGHLDKRYQNVYAGAILGNLASTALGGGSTVVDLATNVGASVGGRVYSQKHELEADGTGTVITRLAGYNAIRGAQFFTQLPDPGNRFLGTHPPNAARIQRVKEVDAAM